MLTQLTRSFGVEAAHHTTADNPRVGRPSKLAAPASYPMRNNFDMRAPSMVGTASQERLFQDKIVASGLALVEMKGVVRLPASASLLDRQAGCRARSTRLEHGCF